MRDHYLILGLTEAATLEEIRRAYRRLAREWHPDHHPGDPLAAHRFKEIVGTAGSEGALEGMVSGEVDEGWAHQHHNLWLEEVKQGGNVAREGDAPDRSATASA